MRISMLDAQLNAARDAADEDEAADGDEAADEEARRAYLRERAAILEQMNLPTEAALGQAGAMEREAEAAEAAEAAGAAGAAEAVEVVEVVGAAESAAAAELAARLLGQVTLDGGGQAAADDGEDEEELPMMTGAEASARAREILAQARRDFGRPS